MIQEMKRRGWTIQQCENFFKECEALNFNEEEYFKEKVLRPERESFSWRDLARKIGFKEVSI